MDAVDATDRTETAQDIEPPSLLTIVLDTNPHAWALLAPHLPFSRAIANLLVFINAHLAINSANQVAVIAAHAERAEWIYPTPASTPHAEPETEMEVEDQGPADDANKYRPFAQLEHAVLTNLRKLLNTTTPSAISSSPATLLAGALTRALTYISKSTASTHPSQNSQQQQFNYSDPSSVLSSTDEGTAPKPGGSTLTPRILILSVSGDLAGSYIELMNTIFACQRLGIKIDVLKLAGDTVFLQQAADTTDGIYISLQDPTTGGKGGGGPRLAGFLQYLMFAFLPSPLARAHLISPGEGEAVDFRAACFCHKKVVEVGWVCSICLSIFCEPLETNAEGAGQCLLCGSFLSMGAYGRMPVVVRRKKVGRKRKGVDGGGVGTPGSAGGTPAPG